MIIGILLITIKLMVFIQDKNLGSGVIQKINNTSVYLEMKGRTNNFVVKKTEIKDKNIYKKKVLI